MQSRDYLVLVRHGSTEWNESGRLNGTTDIPLSMKGLDQAQRLGQQLATCQFDSVFFSSRLRSKQTANAVLENLSGKPKYVIADHRLDEIDFGALENSLVRNLKQPNLELHGELLDRVRATLPRVEKLWEDLRERKGITLAVSHGYLIRAMICHCVLQSSVAKLQRLELSSCGITIINWQNGRPRLICLNGSGDDIRQLNPINGSY